MQESNDRTLRTGEGPQGRGGEGPRAIAPGQQGSTGQTFYHFTTPYARTQT